MSYESSYTNYFLINLFFLESEFRCYSKEIIIHLDEIRVYFWRKYSLLTCTGKSNLFSLKCFIVKAFNWGNITNKLCRTTDIQRFKFTFNNKNVLLYENGYKKSLLLTFDIPYYITWLITSNDSQRCLIKH